TVFDCPTNWQMRRTAARWLPRFARGRTRTVASPVDRITGSGLDTADGNHHDADAIVYATRCAVADTEGIGAHGRTLHQISHDGAAAYLGVAIHGFPNYFMALGPDSLVGGSDRVLDMQRRRIAEGLDLMRHKGGTRIEVRRSAQRQYIERARVGATARAYEVS